jgi:hypothetical protein
MKSRNIMLANDVVNAPVNKSEELTKFFKRYKNCSFEVGVTLREACNEKSYFSNNQEKIASALLRPKNPNDVLGLNSPDINIWFFLVKQNFPPLFLSARRTNDGPMIETFKYRRIKKPLVGFNLHRLVVVGGDKKDVCLYSFNNHQEFAVLDITLLFKRRYLMLGKCSYGDYGHIWDKEDGKYVYSRSCKVCNKPQFKKSYVSTTWSFDY